MHTPTVFVALLIAASTSLAAPAPSTSPDSSSLEPLSTEAPAAWTILSYKKDCHKDDTSCNITFGIDNNKTKTKKKKAAITKCTIKVTNPNGGASRTSYTGKTCDGPGGEYTVSSSWSGQFGPNNGFTTLSVIKPAENLIVWPAYSDDEVQNGKVVVPDKSYVPVSLP